MLMCACHCSPRSHKGCFGGDPARSEYPLEAGVSAGVTPKKTKPVRCRAAAAAAASRVACWVKTQMPYCARWASTRGITPPLLPR